MEHFALEQASHPHHAKVRGDVRAVLHYMHARGNAPDPLFIHRDGKPQTRANLSKRLQNRLSTRAGLQGTYSGHSFRIGAATLATRAGIPDHIIKILGRYLGRFIHSHTCTHGGQCTFFYNAIAVIYVQPYCFVLSSLRVLHRNNTHNI